MRSTLDELITELVELRALVESIDPVNNALADHKDTVVQRYISIRRRFDYAAFAVALYASFEKFVENLITAFVQLETHRVDYAALPQRLTEKHLTVSADLLRRRYLGVGRYIGMSDLDVVRNLFDCLSGTKPYTLNKVAVTAHDTNLRASEVDAIFGMIGIDNICDRVCRSDAMMAWYSADQGFDTQPQGGVKRTVIDERLKDIVERRNQVTHRGGNPTDLLGGAAMNDAIGFIESLATSIFGFVVGRYLQAHHLTSAGSTELALHAQGGTFKMRTVVIVDKPPQRLFVGQPVFVIVESSGARWGRIQSLRVDDAEKQAIEATASAPNGVGIGLDLKFPKGADVKLIALQDDDDMVWSPLESVTVPSD